MKRLVLVACVLVAGAVHAEDALVRREWKVGDATREALVHVPPAATTTATTVIFAFHGHGGTMRHAARTWGYHEKYPEAIVVYPQGLDTPGRTDPEGKKPGWQQGVGQQGDRDLAFVDAMLASLEKDYKVDEKRIFATGHSNGGNFTYLLWGARGDKFTAFAPSSAPAGRNLLDMKPRPALHIAGKKDPIVPFPSQERTIRAVLRINGCADEATDFGPARLHASQKGAPFVVYVHEGGHEFVEGGADLIVKFFREVVK